MEAVQTNAMSDIPLDTITPFTTEIVKYPISERWLNANEYLHMLLLHEKYCETFGYTISKAHPTNIYIQPRSTNHSHYIAIGGEVTTLWMT